MGKAGTSLRDSSEQEEIVKTTCSYDCGGRCLLKVHLADGTISRITTDDLPGQNLKACARGLSQKNVVYAPDRLTKPLRRIGERGSGKFEPISWEEALDKVSVELKRVKGRYGAESIYLIDYFASMSPLHGTLRVGRRFFSFFGGYTTTWGNTSLEAAIFSSQATFGTNFTRNSRDNFLHSNLIILWGWNPVVTRFGSHDREYWDQRWPCIRWNGPHGFWFSQKISSGFRGSLCVGTCD